jgi:dTMP kinase
LGKLDRRLIKALERVSVGTVSPDLTFVLDVPVAVGQERAAKRRAGGSPDRFEAEKTEFHETLRQAYLTLAASEPERCVIVDATATKDDVAKRIWATVNSRLDPAMAPFVFENNLAS